MNPQILVLCTCPDEPSALNIAQHLVEERLAACANVIGGCTSVFRWEGKVETEQERLLLIKTQRRLLDELQNTIVRLHPYELPEVIAVPIDGGLPAYLRWIDACLDPRRLSAE